MRKVLLLFLLVVVAPGAVSAQYAAPNRADVIAHIAEACPGLILQDHAFTDAAATVLNAGAVLPAVGRREAMTVHPDARWGRNGKRGNPNDPSHDAIAFKNPASPFGVSIVDIIGSAGAAAASPAWIDQTAETIRLNTTGVWVAPSGRLPACLLSGAPAPGGGPGEPVTPAPTPSPTPAPDYRAEIAALTAAVAALRSDVAVLRAEASGIRSEAANAHESIYRLIAETLIAEHLDDIKRRIDAVQQQIGQQSSRPAPRWPW